MAGKPSPKTRQGANTLPAQRSAKKPNAQRVTSRSPAKPAAKKTAAQRVTTKTSTQLAAKKTVAQPMLLSGGNPQIAKGDGNAPVQAYIQAMPGWKRNVGRQLDALIVRTVPQVHKAIKWNSPFYGMGGKSWFLSFHCLTKYIKVAFFSGASLQPLPPGKSKQKAVRYLDIYEDTALDEAQFCAWVKQASQLPAWEMG